MIYKRQF